MRFRLLPIDELTIDDKRSFSHVGLYAELERVLRRDDYRFRVPDGGADVSWDRALFLNLTCWDAAEPGGDVLVDARIAADVIAHAAWHHLARRALEPAAGAASAEAMLLGESIASAFDLYLVGRLLGHAPDSDFLATQVPAMADVAAAAGLSEDRFEALLGEVAADPDRAFEELRELLFDLTTSMLGASGIDGAAAALEPFERHRFAPLLHHYELSNWIVAARAHLAAGRQANAARARAVDRALREAPVALDWLEANWLGP